MQGLPLKMQGGQVDVVSMRQESSDGVYYPREELPTATLDAVHRQFLNQLGRCGCGSPLVDEDGVLHELGDKLVCACCVEATD